MNKDNIFSKLSLFIGILGIIIILIMAIFAPVYSINPEGYGSFENILQPPSKEFPMGTDSMGLDVFSEVLWGARTSIKVGVIAVFIAAGIGMFVGLLSGFIGGKIDGFLMGVTDVFLTLPTIPLIIMLSATIKPNINNIAIIIGILSWPRMAKIIRATTMDVSKEDFIVATKAIGIPKFIVIFKHVLICVVPYALVEISSLMSMSILTESSISFLGLGSYDVWSWGKILQNAHSNGVFFTAWWCSLFPSIMIIIFVLSFNLFSIGLKENIN